MDNKKKLNRMASWTIAVFATILAMMMAVMWLISYPNVGNTAFQVLEYILGTIWYIVGLVAVLCIVVYSIYFLYLKNKK